MKETIEIILDTAGIVRACKIPGFRIGYFVEKHGLPAWKDSDAKNARWKARPSSLEKWAADYERKKIGDRR